MSAIAVMATLVVMAAISLGMDRWGTRRKALKLNAPPPTVFDLAGRRDMRREFARLRPDRRAGSPGERFLMIAFAATVVVLFALHQLVIALVVTVAATLISGVVSGLRR